MWIMGDSPWYMLPLDLAVLVAGSCLVLCALAACCLRACACLRGGRSSANGRKVIGFFHPYWCVPCSRAVPLTELGLRCLPPSSSRPHFLPPRVARTMMLMLMLAAAITTAFTTW